MEAKKHKLTEEDIEVIEEDIERIDKVLIYVMEITGVCLRTLPEVVSEPILTKFVPLYAQPLADITKSKEYELTNSLCFFCDCTEFGSESLLNAVAAQIS